MKLNELKTGDLVFMRYGGSGIVMRTDESNYILIPEGGYEALYNFNEDMTRSYDEEADIMLVYRSDDAIATTFRNFEECRKIYERDINWHIPTEEENAAKLEKIRQEEEESHKKWLEERKLHPQPRYISILSQAYYGNRTGTSISVDEVDDFILGAPSQILYKREEMKDRTIVHIPGAEYIVLIYNRLEEEDHRAYLKKVSDKYTPTPTAVIPSLNLTLYSRCIICRMDKYGELQSIENEDFPYFIDYLAL